MSTRGRPTKHRANRLYDVLFAMMKRKGYNFATVAARMGCSQSLASKVACGCHLKTVPTEWQKKLAKVLGVSPRRIFSPNLLEES